MTIKKRGLAPLIIQDIFSIIQKINKDGTTIMVVEQNSNAALRIADRGYVLAMGEVVLEGTAKELLGNEEVKKTYLGIT